MLALLSACATQPQHIPDQTSWHDARASLEAFDEWLMRGKLAVRTPSTSESANLSWQQQGNLAELELSGPLGAGATRITADERWLLIDAGDDQQRYDISATDVIEARLGWPLPVTALPFWVRGVPAPGDLPAELDTNNGELSGFVQDGWTVSYSGWQQQANLKLPTRVTLTNGTVPARLLIRDWQAGRGQ